MTRQELKSWAKEKIKGNIWNVLGAILIVNLISSITLSITTENEFGDFALSLTTGVLSFILEVGLVIYMVNFITDKNYQFEMIFSKFRNWKQIILTYLHQFIMIFLWTLLLIIPGIIKAYGYSLVSYILADDEKITSEDALKLSEEMMKGHKKDLFMLQLSFLGWHLLAIPTLFILEIWIIPYEQTATTKFLYDIKTNYEKEHGTKKIVEEAEVI